MVHSFISGKLCRQTRVGFTCRRIRLWMHKFIYPWMHSTHYSETSPKLHLWTKQHYHICSRYDTLLFSVDYYFTCNNFLSKEMRNCSIHHNSCVLKALQWCWSFIVVYWCLKLFRMSLIYLLFELIFCQNLSTTKNACSALLLVCESHSSFDTHSLHNQTAWCIIKHKKSASCVFV